MQDGKPFAQGNGTGNLIDLFAFPGQLDAGGGLETGKFLLVGVDHAFQPVDGDARGRIVDADRDCRVQPAEALRPDIPDFPRGEADVFELPGRGTPGDKQHCRHQEQDMFDFSHNAKIRIFVEKSYLCTSSTMPMEKKIYIETYGCQMNVNDTEVIFSILARKGYARTEEMSEADVILANTCSVRDNAEQRIHGRIDVFAQQKKARPGVIVGIVG